MIRVGVFFKELNNSFTFFGKILFLLEAALVFAGGFYISYNNGSFELNNLSFFANMVIILSLIITPIFFSKFGAILQRKQYARFLKTKNVALIDKLVIIWSIGLVIPLFSAVAYAIVSGIILI